MRHPARVAARVLRRHGGIWPLVLLRLDGLLALPMVLVASGQLRRFKVGPWLQPPHAVWGVGEPNWRWTWEWYWKRPWASDWALAALDAARATVPGAPYVTAYGALVAYAAWRLWARPTNGCSGPRGRADRYAAALLGVGAMAAVAANAVQAGLFGPRSAPYLGGPDGGALALIVVPSTAGVALMWAALRPFVRPAESTRALVRLAIGTGAAASALALPFLGGRLGLGRELLGAAILLGPVMALAWTPLFGAALVGGPAVRAALDARIGSWLLLFFATQGGLAAVASLVRPVYVGLMQDGSGHRGGAVGLMGLVVTTAIIVAQVALALVAIGMVAVAARRIQRRAAA